MKSLARYERASRLARPSCHCRCTSKHTPRPAKTSCGHCGARWRGQHPRRVAAVKRGQLIANFCGQAGISGLASPILGCPERACQQPRPSCGQKQAPRRHAYWAKVLGEVLGSPRDSFDSLCAIVELCAILQNNNLSWILKQPACSPERNTPECLTLRL